jgi:hypothetical protein
MANLNKFKKFHYLYKTTNLINNKFYIGIHSTNNLDDGYLGSGKKLKYSIKKYGKENFKLEIIEFFENRELLVEKEKQIINDELLQNLDCMNLKYGGDGGAQPPNIQRKWIDAGKSAYLKKLSTDPKFKEKCLNKLKNGTKRAHKEGKYRYDNFKGKKHTTESKEKMSELKKNKGLGTDNSQFGTMWITNGIINKKIKKENIIPNGWKKGRNIINNN